MSVRSHPRRQELRRFVDGKLDGAGNRRIVRHLLGGCGRCRSVAAKLWRPGLTGDTALAVDKALGAVGRRKAGIEAERAAVPGLLGELEAQPSSRQLLLTLNSLRFCNWFLCEALLQRAFEAGLSEPSEALRLAEMGVALAGRLIETAPGDEVNYDLLARGWSVLGNARRISSDFEGAEEAFCQAMSSLERGSGDPLEAARVVRRHGLLHHDRRCFSAAARCFDRAVRLYRSAGDDHLVGKALAEKARVVGENGDSEGMIELLRRAVALLDPARDPRYSYIVQHNLTWALNESGRLDEALSTLQEILPLHVSSAKPMDLLRLRWLEGKLAQAQDELERAEAAFREVRGGFLEREVPYDAALASLDLAAVLCQQNRIAEMKQLAAESLPVFRSLGIHREALAALALFQHAVERERVSLRFLSALADYLQQARSNPSLAFQPPA